MESPAVAAHLAGLRERASDVDHVAAVRVDATSADGRIALATVQLDDTSLLVAVKAAVMNVLAIGAACGVMALALSGGRLGQAIGIPEATPVPVWLPMMMFAILFGLSMDYEVFLLSRIREEYLRTGDNASAVAHGMARTGRVISAAAAIMVTVFGAFMLSDQVIMKVAGLGLAAAVLLDATVVRMVLVPSTMELLGDRNWWLPRWEV